MSPPPPFASSLTQTLLTTHKTSFERATQHSFLAASGRGTLPAHTLSSWLSQDRLYGQAYINFIGGLLARVQPPIALDPERKHLQWRITDLLTAALTNIHREWKFYVDVARRYGLDVDGKKSEDGVMQANAVTQMYVDLFRSFGRDPGKGLLEGMVVLWATEKCYLEAWSYALAEGERKSKSGTEEGGEERGMDGGALRKEFIPNWTSKEFVEFVKEIASLMDELARIEEPNSGEMEACENAFKTVLELEENFWPNVEV